MSPDRTLGRRSLYLSAVPALALCALPLPHVLDVLRPDFLLLVVIWFALMAPRAGGLLFAWCAGLALDAFRGVLLGEHALAFVVIAYIVHRFHLRVRMYPLAHQSLVVFGLLFVFQFLLFWVDGVAGEPVTDWMRWLPVVSGALFWPLLTGILGRFVTHG